MLEHPEPGGQHDGDGQDADRPHRGAAGTGEEQDEGNGDGPQGEPGDELDCRRPVPDEGQLDGGGLGQSLDRVLANVMKDPRLAKMMDPKKMPFDGKRMIYGGFKVIVEA